MVWWGRCYEPLSHEFPSALSLRRSRPIRESMSGAPENVWWRKGRKPLFQGHLGVFIDLCITHVQGQIRILVKFRIKQTILTSSPLFMRFHVWIVLPGSLSETLYQQEKFFSPVCWWSMLQNRLSFLELILGHLREPSCERNMDIVWDVWKDHFCLPLYNVLCVWLFRFCIWFEFLCQLVLFELGKGFPFAPDPQRHEVERPRLTHFGGFAHVAHVGEPLMRWMQGEVGRVSCRIGRPSN